MPRSASRRPAARPRVDDLARALALARPGCAMARTMVSLRSTSLSRLGPFDAPGLVCASSARDGRGGWSVCLAPSASRLSARCLPATAPTVVCRAGWCDEAVATWISGFLHRWWLAGGSMRRKVDHRVHLSNRRRGARDHVPGGGTGPVPTVRRSIAAPRGMRPGRVVYHRGGCRGPAALVWCTSAREDCARAGTPRGWGGGGWGAWRSYSRGVRDASATSANQDETTRYANGP